FAGRSSAGVRHSMIAAVTTSTITRYTPDPSAVGQAIAVTYTVTSTGGTPTGNITVSAGSDTCTGTVAAGTCNLTPTTAGAKTLTATYAGNTDFAGSRSTSADDTTTATGPTSIITA